MRRHAERRGYSTIASRDNGKLIQQGMDQTHSVADDINKILRAVESMTNTIQGLSTRVQSTEEELQKFQEIQRIPKEEDIIPQKEESEFDPKKHLPPFPVHFDPNVYCKWVETVESIFLKWNISEYEQVDFVARTLPVEELKWWKGMQMLCWEIDTFYPLLWDEMKKMIMVRFLYPECPGTNKDSVSPPPKNID